MSDTRPREPTSAPHAGVKAKMHAWRAAAFAGAPDVDRDAGVKRDPARLFVDRHGRAPEELRAHGKLEYRFVGELEAMLQALDAGDVITGREVGSNSLFNRLLFVQERFELLARRDMQWAEQIDALRKWDAGR